MTDPLPDPEHILAGGTLRGIALEPFVPVWSSARLRLSRAGWQAATLAPFLNLDVPYASTSSGRLSDDAVLLALAARPGVGGLRILELGSGSGVFARLFLDALRQRAPDRYAASRYVASDGSASILAAQRAMGVLDDHEGIVTQAVLDVAGDWSAMGSFDVILANYVFDSLSFDLLAIRDERTWRREVRGVLPETLRAEAEALRAALSDPAGADIQHFVHLGPRISHQTRHVPIDRATLPHGDTLPEDTGGETVPLVHSSGAIDAIARALSQLSPAGVLIFSDYGHLIPYTRHETPEFQTYGQSVAVGLNLGQIALACDRMPEAHFYAPDEEDGHLHTRVLQRGSGPDLSDVVNDLLGALRHRAMTAPVDAAREVVRARMYERARGFYASALRLQPRNWTLLQEITLFLLIPNGEYDAALEMAAIGLAINPLAADLWRARGEALLALDRVDEALAALDRAAALGPGNVAAHRARADALLRKGRHGAALAALAEALAHDREGDAQEVLLTLQGRVLADIARTERDLLIASANPFLPLDRLPD